MSHYTTKQKVLVIELIARNGGVVDKEVLATARDILNADITQRTLFRWWNDRERFQAGDTVNVAKKSPDKKTAVVGQDWARETLDNYFEKIAHTYLDHAVKDDVVKKTSGNQAVMTAAVAVDKMRLLRGLPTEIVSIMPDLMASIKAAGLEPLEFLQTLKSKLDQQVASGHDNQSRNLH